jgi:hypothetical protein
VNLLSQTEGGQVIAAPNASWEVVIDGKDVDAVGSGGACGEAIFGFKDEKPALVSRFDILIPSTDAGWVKDFELLAADDSPTGTYRSLGKFTTQNMRMMRSPYQSFAFPETPVKYLKLKLLASQKGDCWMNVTQIRAMGKPAP